MHFFSLCFFVLAIEEISSSVFDRFRTGVVHIRTRGFATRSFGRRIHIRTADLRGVRCACSSYEQFFSDSKYLKLCAISGSRHALNPCQRKPLYLLVALLTSECSQPIRMLPPPHPAGLVERPQYVCQAGLNEPDRYRSIGITVQRQVSPFIALYPHMMRRNPDIFVAKWRLGVYDVSRKSHNPLRGERIGSQWVAI